MSYIVTGWSKSLTGSYFFQTSIFMLAIMFIFRYGMVTGND